MRFLNIRQVICKIASRWDLKSRDFSNCILWANWGKILNISKKQQKTFGTTQVIKIKLVSLKSDFFFFFKKEKKKERKKRDLCKYIV